jgi:hypothetical protein
VRKKNHSHQQHICCIEVDVANSSRNRLIYCAGVGIHISSAGREARTYGFE